MTNSSSNTVPISSAVKSKHASPQSSSLISQGHIASDLLCPDDRDVDELPGPRYTPDDIRHVQRVLLHFVPPELADAIIDMAEFWPYVSVSRNSFTPACAALEAPDSNAQWCYLVSPTIPAVVRDGASLPTTVKKVNFSIKTYESSFGKTANDCKGTSQGYKTWFESSILKSGQSGIKSYDDQVSPNDWYASTTPHPKFLNNFGDVNYPGHPVESPLDKLRRWHVRLNPQSSSDKEWHKVTWKQGALKPAVDVGPLTEDGDGVDFVDSLEVNDRVILMARAMSPGWINLVFNVKIDIYYAFSSSYL